MLLYGNYDFRYFWRLGNGSARPKNAGGGGNGSGGNGGGGGNGSGGGGGGGGNGGGGGGGSGDGGSGYEGFLGRLTSPVLQRLCPSLRFACTASSGNIYITQVSSKCQKGTVA